MENVEMNVIQNGAKGCYFVLTPKDPCAHLDGDATGYRFHFTAPSEARAPSYEDAIVAWRTRPRLPVLQRLRYRLDNLLWEAGEYLSDVWDALCGHGRRRGDWY